MFRGRLRRRTYWGRILGLYATLLPIYAGLNQWVQHQVDKEGYGIILMVMVLMGITLLGSIQTVKRLHDTNLAGWWWWLLMVPIVSNLFAAGISLVDGTVGPNRFGPDPKNRQAYSPLDTSDALTAV